jgi:hypothetical protein
MEARYEGVELLLHSLLNFPFRDQSAERSEKVSSQIQADSNQSLLDIFMLVFVSDSNIAAIRYEVDCVSLPKFLIVNRKGELNDAIDIVLSADGE